MKKIASILLSLLCCGCIGCAPSHYDDLSAFRYYTQSSREVFASGITFRAAVRGGNEQAALDEMSVLLNEIDADMSITRADSPLSVFNALDADKPLTEGYRSERVEISRRTYDVLTKSLAYYDDTSGAFNIAVHPLAKLWHTDAAQLGDVAGIDPSQAPPPPDENVVREVAAYCDPHNLILTQEAGVCYVAKAHPKLQIDLGAVAKGYAAEECIRIAKAHGAESALINISGNVCLLGQWYHPAQAKYVRWEVGVTSPSNGFGDICALSVSGGKTLVTSGDYMRYYQTMSGGEVLTVPHIIDSRTGLPLGVCAISDGYRNEADSIVSATVICADSAMADAYATAVCLMGREKAIAFLRERGLHGIIFTRDGKMALVGVTERDETGEEYFIRKDSYGGYKQYACEEYAVG